MACFTASLLPNPFKPGTASYVIAERLKRKPQQPLRELFQGLDVASPYNLLHSHVKPVYARRSQKLVIQRGQVTLRNARD